jgi:hypothetical protein
VTYDIVGGKNPDESRFNLPSLSFKLLPTRMLVVTGPGEHSALPGFKPGILSYWYPSILRMMIPVHWHTLTAGATMAAALAFPGRPGPGTVYPVQIPDDH